MWEGGRDATDRADRQTNGWERTSPVGAFPANYFGLQRSRRAMRRGSRIFRIINRAVANRRVSAAALELASVQPPVYRSSTILIARGCLGTPPSRQPDATLPRMQRVVAASSREAPRRTFSPETGWNTAGRPTGRLSGETYIVEALPGDRYRLEFLDRARFPRGSGIDRRRRFDWTQASSPRKYNAPLFGGDMEGGSLRRLMLRPTVKRYSCTVFYILDERNRLRRFGRGMTRVR
jgi:hypothetical protein